MKWFRVFFLIFVVSPFVVEAQTQVHVAKPCSQEKVRQVASQKILDELYAARRLRNTREANQKAVDVANEPGSGLAVLGLEQRPDGLITAYMIVPAGDHSCYVALMHFSQE